MTATGSAATASPSSIRPVDTDEFDRVGWPRCGPTAQAAAGFVESLGVGARRTSVSTGGCRDLPGRGPRCTRGWTASRRRDGAGRRCRREGFIGPVDGPGDRRGTSDAARSQRCSGTTSPRARRPRIRSQIQAELTTASSAVPRLRGHGAAAARRRSGRVDVADPVPHAERLLSAWLESRRAGRGAVVGLRSTLTHGFRRPLAHDAVRHHGAHRERQDAE